MGRPAFGAERWAAVRALREGGRPVFTLLATATGLHPDTIQQRALREAWGQPVGRPVGQSAAKAEGLGGEAAEAFALAAAGIEEAASAAELAGDATIEERLGRLTELLLREVEAVGRATERGGQAPDKARVDAVWSMIRVVERLEAFARERAGGEQVRRDGEMGDVLRRIDARIEELARAYAKELVGGESEPGGGAARP